MKSCTFQIELLGGPADGLQLTTDKIPGPTIRMPASPSRRLSNDDGKRGPAGRHWAEYELLWRRCGRDAHGATIVRMGYDFVGCRATRERSHAKRFAATLLRLVAAVWMKNPTGGSWLPAFARRMAAAKRSVQKPASAGTPVGRHEARTGLTVTKRRRIRHP